MAFIIVKKSDAEDEGKVFPLNKASTFIGRRTLQYTPDIELSSEVVSRRHVEILQRDTKFLLRDLGSTNGTMLDDDRILPGKLYDLKHNSKIGLGVEGDIALIVLQFKETEGTNIIDRKKATPRVKITWLKIDEAKKDAWVDGKQAKLSKKEYDLLQYLYRYAGNICSRDEIIKSVWPESKDPGAISDATIDQLVHRLREKVEPEPSQPVRIVSKKAFGYMLV
ncbi:MAG: winged helix-turn-helix domain-containing protein [Chloroflexi bacterium]|nr:winged helix-turn-helix domain-containing protein [Chloroflexota bacterium]